MCRFNGIRMLNYPNRGIGTTTAALILITFSVSIAAALSGYSSSLFLNLSAVNIDKNARALMNTASCSSLPVNQLNGVNYVDPTLYRTQVGLQSNLLGAPPPGLSLAQINQYGFNLVRVPFYWEAYNLNPGAVLTEMESIASTAKLLNMCIVLDFNQYGTSSYFYNSKWDGGFPWFMLGKYPFNGGSSAEQLFWTDFYNNTITVSGVTAWDLQANLFHDIINRVDSYNSVIGYEILNEPPIYDNSQYQKLGNYHTFIAQKMREYGTSKFILFDRAYPVWNTAYVDWNYYPKIAPTGVDKIIFAPHRYSVVYNDIFGNYQKLASMWGGIPVILGEWAEGTQSDTTNFVAELKRVGFGWTYYGWTPGNDMKHLVNTSFQPTIYLAYLSTARQIYYP